MKHQQILSRVFICATMVATATNVAAQSGTNSPYSQYGLGVLSDQSQGQSRGMGGVGIGMRSGTNVNSLNPASYSSIDSLTMIIDAGLAGQITNFKEGGRRINANNANFEYITASFRVMPRMGVSVGMLPYTNIGYNYYSTSKVGSSTTTSTEVYDGEGGLHQAYLGVGWKAWKGLSVGINAAYLWGSYDRTVTIGSNDSYVNTMTRTYSATIGSYKLDFGAQWEHSIGKQDHLTIGAVYGLGHKLGDNPTMTLTNTNSQTAVTTTTDYEIDNGLSIPHTFGIGASWQRSTSIIVAADYSLQKWGSESFPYTDNTTGTYTLRSGMLKDRHKIAAGAEWTPNAMSRSLLKRVHYRIGASFNTPYIKINGQDGPKEYGVSAGLGIPITNTWNNRSVLNISAQWGHASASGMVTENTFRINIGLTFNERWFMKWKVE